MTHPAQPKASSALRRRITGVQLVLLVLGLMAQGLVGWQIAQRQALEAVNTHSAALVRAHAEALEHWVAGRHLQLMAAAQALDKPGPPESVLQQAQVGGEFLGLWAWSAQGEPLAGIPSRPLQTGPQASASLWAEALAGTSVVMGAPTTRPGFSDGRFWPLLYVHRAGTTPLRAVWAALPVDQVVLRVSAIQPTVGSQALLVDDAGRVIAHADEARWLQPAQRWSEALAADRLESLRNASELAQATFDGQAALLRAAPVLGTGWTLVLVVDRQQALAGVTQLAVANGLMVLMVTTLAALLLSWTLSRLLARLGKLRDAMLELAHAQGDLSKHLPTAGRTDELQEIAQGFNRFVDKTRAILIDIRARMEAVEAVASRLGQGNSELRERTHTAVQHLQATRNGLEPWMQSAQQGVEAAQAAHSLAEQASGQAATGASAMAAAVSSMGDIGASSQKMAEIIGLIDSIAFQTNILALNAAVEAARAGEQGRGFAVVASEVRALAQRSASAAREVRGLIDSSVTLAQQGQTRVEQAGVALQAILDGVVHLNAQMARLAEAARDQSAGLSEIGSALSGLDQNTQQNALLVEQQAAVAADLQQETVGVRQGLGRFHLG